MIKLPKKLNAEILPTNVPSNRFKTEDDGIPELKVRFIDSFTGHIWGYLVVDNTRRGTSVGGIRLAEDLTLEEMSRLAYAM
ncbi:uncharacterized protein METZ01_LOCUS366541, partial [marine metagenome]